MKSLVFISLLSVSAASAHEVWKEPRLISYVKPLVGTQRMGHTFPGATVPFGSVQLSPETDTLSYELDGKYNKDVYKYCAGYQYEDKTIVGFTHTHFSGTGHSDLGDILLMPTTGELKLNPGVARVKGSGYRSRFSHKNEVAEANYYSVKLDDYNIKAELTTTTRVGFHQYTFPKSDSAHIVLDMMYGIYNYPGKNVWTYLRVIDDTTVVGFRQTNGWAKTRIVYFAMKFSKPFLHHGFQDNSKREVYKGFWRKFDQSKDFPEIAGQQIKAWFDFKTNEMEQIKVKVALSPVSQLNALENMRAEAPGWNLGEIVSKGKYQWEQELAKIRIGAGEDLATRQNFYTAMYHAFIGNTVYMDVNGEYMGVDRNIHRAGGFTNYTTFSLWDTYRALHPLFNIIQRGRNADMIQSMVEHFAQSPEHMLPVWSNSGNENWCMIGFHSVSVIADALAKGTISGRNLDDYTACTTTANNGKNDGLPAYISLGYVPEDKHSSSVSKTLEYAYDDWCIDQMAGKMGLGHKASTRSQNFKNVFDPSTGFMRPRMSDGSFKKDFDVLNTDEPGYIEGNAWNYSLYVPHDVPALIELMGGNKRFVPHLDSLFEMQLPDSFFAKTEDITRDGIIGNYVHGNEPSHHIPYLYNWTGTPWKTQQRVRMILNKMYKPTPDGLSGNDDCGQMSAWYIFSALGFYPVCPGSTEYQLGSPCIGFAEIHLDNGKIFGIRTEGGKGKRNVYVSKVTLNGKLIGHTIDHADIMAGGELIFYMSDMHPD